MPRGRATVAQHVLQLIQASCAYGKQADRFGRTAVGAEEEIQDLFHYAHDGTLDLRVNPNSSLGVRNLLVAFADGVLRLAKRPDWRSQRVVCCQLGEGVPIAALLPGNSMH